MKLNHKSIKNLAIIYYIPEMNEWKIFYTSILTYIHNNQEDRE